MYEQDKLFRESLIMLERKLHDSRIDGGQDVAPSNPGREKLFSDQTWDFLTEVCTGVPVHRVEAQTSLGGSHIHKAVVQTILGLLYRLSNKSLDDESSQALRMIIRAPSWDAVLPYLRDVLDVIDTHIIQAIAEGLFKKGIETCCHRMLELSLSLGADPKQRITDDFGRPVLSTPMAVLCERHRKRSPETECQFRNPERLILSLLAKETHVSNGTLVQIISASCHAIAERIILSQPERNVDFTIAKSDLEGGHWFLSTTCNYDRVTPLLMACSDERLSDEKLSLIRCLLNRNAKPDLKVMKAAAGACDGGVVSLLHQFGAPINGLIPGLGSPLSSACKRLQFPRARCDCIHLLLSLGASPDFPIGSNTNVWEDSPFHILARSKEEPAVTEALDLLIEHSAGILKSAHMSENLQIRNTPLECAIEDSRWVSAFQLLSADCELTGREILLIDSNVYNREWNLRETAYHRSRNLQQTVQRRFRRFFDAFLEKAPMQTAVLDWRGLTVLQRAIQNQNEAMILALLEFGLTTSPSDFLYMLPKSLANMIDICSLSKSVQMKLLFASECPEFSILDVLYTRIILAFACPEAIRHTLNLSPELYDSEGLCYAIVRLVSKDRASYFPPDTCQQYQEQENQIDSITMDDLYSILSRRTILKLNKDWESTAVAIAARAGRVDILQILTESSQGHLRESGLIPRFLLQSFLEHSTPDSTDADEYNWYYLGLWIKYCRMRDPSIRCSPLTAAVMVVPEAAAEETFDSLLALNYQPDGWTVLVASCQGRISILQRLRVLECWPHILRHEDRPDWCPTALQGAVFNARDITARFLLEAGTMLNEADLPPCRPICIAMPGSDPYLSTTILPRTALQHAVDRESTEMTMLLVNAGANVNAPAGMNSGATALQIASIQGSIPIVTYLINRGASPFAPGAVKHGRTAVQGAAEHGRKDVVELLLAHGEFAPHQHRQQLVKAVFYAVKNAQHVVARILRERVLPPWSSQDEETLELFSKDWESSSENSARSEWLDKFEEWEGSSEDGSELSWESDRHPSSDMESEEKHVENAVAFGEDESWSLQEIEETVEYQRDLDVRQIGEIDLYDGDFASGLSLQEEIAYWIEGQPSFEGFGVDNTLLDDFSFGSLI